jgi:hypothetical protein
MNGSLHATVPRKRKPSFYAYVGFLGVHRNDCGEVRVQLLTSRRSINIVDEG